MPRAERSIAVALAGALIGGCGGSAPILDDSPGTLSTPEKQALTREAAQLHHPRVTPITLDFSKPLSGDELGVIAVLVNPELKALRAKEGVAEAQVFDAGLLPDPQLAKWGAPLRKRTRAISSFI